MTTLEAEKFRDKLVLHLKLALALYDMLSDLVTDLYFTSMFTSDSETLNAKS